MLTQDELKSVLSYNQDTGVFTYLKTRGPKKSGSIAGSIDPEGYVRIKIFGKSHRAHRLAYLYVHGSLPENEVDHKNGLRADNRWPNIRKATKSENRQNLIAKSKNASGYLGVFPDTKSKKWIAVIVSSGDRKYLGSFDSPKKAHSVYVKAKSELHAFQPGPREPE